MKNKNEVYVLNQPTHVNMSLVVIDETYPISDATHEGLDKLKEITDMVFVFSDEFYPESKKIDKNKFSSLYGACAWIESNGNFPLTFFKMLKYSKEIFEREISYTIINISNISSINISQTINNIRDLSLLDIERPIFKINRLSSQEYYNIYSRDPKEKTSIKDKLSKLMNRSSASDIPVNIIDMFCSYTSDSSIVYMKSSFVNLLLKFQEEDTTKKYIESFKERGDIRYLIASLVKYLGLENINSDLDKLDLYAEIDEK